ncbi:hypothetical protein BT96DRAFT_1006446 [Gymnopus androsaceus JB14]|uniref:Uncharacterized protein n=1 Tax=Gymnopus androsaceus JB14 TaxID=1447944 RepID=A0A6A4GLB6_9AGAR|nr:hypothetical protein BT96DRAFT_1006446 [Gymnopus androsaceus JB14]
MGKHKNNQKSGSTSTPTATSTASPSEATSKKSSKKSKNASALSNPLKEASSTTPSIDTHNTPLSPENNEEHTKGRKKHGNQGTFHGLQLDYLEKHLREYATITLRGDESKWLSKFADQWFTKWLWHTGEEPEEFAVLGSEAGGIEPANTLSETGNSTTLSDKDRQTLVNRREEHHTQVKANGAKKASPAAAAMDPLQSMLKLLLQMGKGSRCCTEDAKFYMKHKVYKPKVDEVFEHRVKEDTGLGSSDHLDLWVKIARELWEKEDKSIQEAVIAENKEAFERLQNLQERLVEGGGLTWNDLGEEQEEEMHDFLIGYAAAPTASGSSPIAHGIVLHAFGWCTSKECRRAVLYDDVGSARYVVGMFMMFMSNKDPGGNFDDPSKNTGTSTHTTGSAMAINKILSDGSLLSMPSEDMTKVQVKNKVRSKKWKKGSTSSKSQKQQVQSQGDTKRDNSESEAKSISDPTVEANPSHMLVHSALPQRKSGGLEPAMPLPGGPQVMGPMLLPSKLAINYMQRVMTNRER